MRQRFATGCQLGGRCCRFPIHTPHFEMLKVQWRASAGRFRGFHAYCGSLPPVTVGEIGRGGLGSFDEQTVKAMTLDTEFSVIYSFQDQQTIPRGAR